MKRQILKADFFNRPVLRIAPDLLGKFLVRKKGRREIAVMITEVEAYDGTEDKACHASKGRTPRTEVMFGPAGYFYIYLCYGMYWMLNVVTGPKGYPAAVLIRGIIPNLRTSDVRRLNGPGKVTKELKIDKRFNALPARPDTGLWFEDRGVMVEEKNSKKTPRIGVSYAGPVWSKKKYRFVLLGESTKKRT